MSLLPWIAYTDLGEIIKTFVYIAIILSIFGGPVLKAFMQKKKDEQARQARQRRRAEVAEETEQEEETPAPKEHDTSPPSMEDVLDEMFGRGWRKGHEAPREEDPVEVRPSVKRVVVAPVEVIVPPSAEETARPAVAPASVPAAPPAPVAVAARVKPSLDLSDMQRAVILSEVLGPPMGLRSDRASWAA